MIQDIAPKRLNNHYEPAAKPGPRSVALTGEMIAEFIRGSF